MPLNPNPPQYDDFVAQVVTDLPNPPEGAIALWGYLNDAENVANPVANRISYRLYRTLQFNEYIEILDADALWVLSLANLNNPVGGTIIWISRDARVKYVCTSMLDVQAGFLRGPISGGMSASPYMGGWQPGLPGGVSLGCPGGGVSLGCPGGGVSLGCPGGGVSLGCPGGGVSLGCPGGGVSFLVGVAC